MKHRHEKGHFSKSLRRGLQYVRKSVKDAVLNALISFSTARMKAELGSRRQNTSFIPASMICGLILLFAVFWATVGGFFAFIASLLAGLLIVMCLYKIAPRFFRSFNPTLIRKSARDTSLLTACVQEMSARAKIAVPSLFLWDSDSVFACCVPSGRNKYYLILTTFLVDGLTKDELAAVVAHEVSHIEQNDARWRMILLGLTSILSRAARPVGTLLYHLVPVTNVLSKGLKADILGSRSDREAKPYNKHWLSALGHWTIVFYSVLFYSCLLVLLGFGAVLYIPVLLSVALAFTVSRSQELIADYGAVLLTLQPFALIDALVKVHELQIDTRKLSFAEALFNLDNSHVILDWNDPFAEWLINSSPTVRAIFQRLLRSHPVLGVRIKRLQSLSSMEH